MLLSATLSIAELSRIVRALIPLRIDLSEPDSSPRWLDVVELLDSSIDEDAGVCVAVRAEVHWPERDLFDTIEIPSLALLIAPSLVATDAGVGLCVQLRCSTIDVRWVPDFLDRRVVAAINERLASAEFELLWDLSDALSFRVPETSARSNVLSVVFDVSTATLSFGDHGVNISGPMTIEIERQPPHTLQRDEPRSVLNPNATHHGASESS